MQGLAFGHIWQFGILIKYTQIFNPATLGIKIINNTVGANTGLGVEQWL